LLWDSLLFEDTFECIFEPLRCESIKNYIDTLGEFLWITALKMRSNSIKICIGSEYN